MKKMLLSLKGIVAALVVLVATVAALIGSYQSGIQTPAEPSFGAIPGDSLDGKEFTVGGVKHYYEHQDFFLATTTPCTISAPAGTTTALVNFSFHAAWATSTALQYTLATSTLRNATTSRIAYYDFAGGLQGKFGLDSSMEADGALLTVEPGQFITVGVGGPIVTLARNFTAAFASQNTKALGGGSCNAVFRSL